MHLRFLLLICVASLYLGGCGADVEGPNRAPVARAGLDQVFVLGSGQAVEFDGSGSFDPDGDSPLEYQWRVTHRPMPNTAELQDPTTARPGLAPTSPGTWILTLTVGDGTLWSELDVVRLTVVGQICDQDVECDDGNWCNGSEICVEQECASGTPIDCDDGDSCTQDVCDELNDECLSTLTPIPGAESLTVDGSCEDGVDNDCDGATDMEDNECDFCDADGDCNDGNACTINSCSANSCVLTFAPEFTACDDQLFCNGDQDECNDLGICGPSAASVSPCLVPCMTVCDEGTDTCTQSPLGTPCPDPGDGFDCTVDVCDDLGSCAGTPDNQACGAGEYCLPNCNLDTTGCVPEPGSLTVTCTGGGTPTCTVETGLENQGDCLVCEAEIAPTVFEDNDFATPDGSACDLDGWQLVTGDVCSEFESSCALQEEINGCCNDPNDGVCIARDGGWALRTDLQRNCGDNGFEEWRLQKTFDTTGYIDLELCFEFSENSANADEYLIVNLTDETNVWPGGTIFCQNDGLGVDDDDVWYPICRPLDLVGTWPEDNPNLTITFVAHSETDDDQLFIRHPVLRGWPIAYPRNRVDVFSDDFTGCSGQLQDGTNGWSVNGQLDCPAFAACASSIAGYTGTPVEAHDNDVLLERRQDVTQLDDQVTVCFWYGEYRADGNEGMFVNFEPYSGAGWVSAWIDEIEMGPDGCRRECVNLSDIDPAVNNSPDLGIQFDMDSDSNDRRIALAKVQISGSQFQPAGPSVEFGSFDDSIDENVYFDLTNPESYGFTSRITCRWTPSGTQVTGSGDVLLE